MIDDARTAEEQIPLTRGLARKKVTETSRKCTAAPAPPQRPTAEIRLGSKQRETLPCSKRDGRTERLRPHFSHLERLKRTIFLQRCLHIVLIQSLKPPCFKPSFVDLQRNPFYNFRIILFAFCSLVSRRQGNASRSFKRERKGK